MPIRLPFRSPRVLALCSFCLLAIRVSSASGADEWPQFRGPEANGHSTAVDLPVEWSEDRNITWKTPIAGQGHSSPVISGDQIWLTTAVATPLTDDEKTARLAKVANSNGLTLAGRISLRAVCVSRESGAIQHDVELFSIDEPEPIHSLNSYASPTPILSESHVYCHFGSYGTGCVDAATGKVLWTSREHHVDHQNGPGASPTLWNDLLIINFDGIDTQFVAALDTTDGHTVWKTKRSGEMHEKADFQKAYSTSAIVEDATRSQLISPGANWVYSYDPRTGQELWKANYGKLGFSTVPCPVSGHGMVFISTSYIQPRLLAVKYDGNGDVTGSHVAWQIDGQLPQKPSMLLVGDNLHFLNDKGIAVCLNALTGEEVWMERIGGQFSASPVCANGRIYYFSQEGRAIVIDAGREYRLLAENTLDAGCMASPAIAGRALFVRTDTHLYRIEKTTR